MSVHKLRLGSVKACLQYTTHRAIVVQTYKIVHAMAKCCWQNNTSGLSATFSNCFTIVGLNSFLYFSTPLSNFSKPGILKFLGFALFDLEPKLKLLNQLVLDFQKDKPGDSLMIPITSFKRDFYIELLCRYKVGCKLIEDFPDR